ncbi:mitochondrial escape protein 2 [Podochytrium sp. JEL0797]|nr:mitochondrial escape protein 2 [Podochytrium sp. JEL0797]
MSIRRLFGKPLLGPKANLLLRGVATTASPGAYSTMRLNPGTTMKYSAMPGSLAGDDSKALAVWFEGVYPVKLSRWDPRHLYANYYATQLKEDAKKMIPPPDEFKSRFTYLNSVSSIKEGGLLVRFLYEGDKKEAFDTIDSYLEGKGGMRSVLTLGTKLKAHPVEGVPWIEDLRSSIPSSRINLAFKGPELPIETLYNEFRGYGKIDTVNIQQGTAKDSAKFGHIQFLTSRAATSARICMNGKKIDNTTIYVTYEPALNRNAVMNFVKDHPRISLPIILAILAILSFLIFDPMRVFFVTNRVTERFSISKWFGTVRNLQDSVMRWIYGELPVVGEDEEGDISSASYEVLKERKEHEAKLMMYLKETPDTAMLIFGPKGTRSGDLIEKCTKNEPYVLRIDLDELINQPDHVMLNRLASQIGCFPMFNWTVSSGAVLDTLVTAGTGIKAGLSSTTDSQIQKIFEIATIALNKITSTQLAHRQQAIDAHHRHLHTLQDGSEKDNELALVIPEIQYPIVIVEGFLANEKGKQAHVYEKVAEWGAGVTELKVAQVVFMSDNAAALKFLGRAIPNRTIDTIALADASHTSALAYAHRRLGLHPSQKLPPQIDQYIRAMGGRLNDLEQMMQKTKAALKAQRHREAVTRGKASLMERLRGAKGGVVDLSDAAVATEAELMEAVEKAFNDIVVRTETEVRKVGLFEEVGIAGRVEEKKEWSAVQMWKVILLLTKYEEVSYDDLRYHALFKGDEGAIQAIERAGLISVGVHEGRPYTIRAGRPVYRSAYTRLQSDSKYAAIMGLKTVKVLIADETAKLMEYEKELATLTGQVSVERMGWWSGAGELKARVSFLARMVGESHGKLAGWDAEERRLKRVVKLVE